MTTFNSLSGSTIDISKKLLFDIFSSGNCYLGFARGIPDIQWGINTLVSIEHPSVSGSSIFPSLNVASTNDTATSNKFFDLNSLKSVGSATDVNRIIYIAKVINSDTNLSNPQYLDLGDLKLVHIGEHWAVIEGLPYNYHELLTPSTSASYYIMNYEYNTSVAVKILDKASSNIPSYTTPCVLAMDLHDGKGYKIIKEGLERRVNSLGEIEISGLYSSNLDNTDVFNESVSAMQHKFMLTGNGTTIDPVTFRLIDSNGNIIYDNMTYDNIDAGNIKSIWGESTFKKFIPMKFPLYIKGDIVYQRLNLYSEINENDLGIWSEFLPFDGAVKSSDSNPPPLEVSYIRNLNVDSSIFDIKGLTKILPSEVSFVKQIMNEKERSFFTTKGFQIQELELNVNSIVHSATTNTLTSVGGDTSTIYVNNNFDILTGDILNIPYDVSNPNGPKRQYKVIKTDYTQGSASITIYPSLPNVIPVNYVLNTTPSDVSNSISLAFTTDAAKALQYGFTSLKIEKIVDKSSPTEGLYRQLFISYLPKDSTGAICSAETYGDIFNINNHKYDIGSLIYLANKKPIYRKYLSQDEHFTIII